MTPQENTIFYALNQIEEQKQLLKQYPHEKASVQKIIDGWQAVIDRMRNQLQEN